MAPDLLILALAYYRAPLRFPHLRDANRPLPESIAHLVPAFGSALSPRHLEATAAELGASSEEIDRAARFFLRQVLLAPGASHYRVLGLTPAASDETIRQHYQLLVRIFHPDRSLEDAERDAAYAARINEAYRLLKSSAARRKYDRRLGAAQAQAETKGAGEESSLASQAPFARPQFGEPKGASWLKPRRAAKLGLWGGLAVVLVGFLVVARYASQPILRVNPELGDEQLAKPSYLQGPVSSPSRGSRSPGAASPLAEASRSGQGGGAPREESPPDTAAASPVPLPELASIDLAERVLARGDIRDAILREREREPRSETAEPAAADAAAKEAPQAPAPAAESAKASRLPQGSGSNGQTPVAANTPEPPAVPSARVERPRQEAPQGRLEPKPTGSDEKPASIGGKPETRGEPEPGPSPTPEGPPAEQRSKPPKAGSTETESRVGAPQTVTTRGTQAEAKPAQHPKKQDRSKPEVKTPDAAPSSAAAPRVEKGAARGKTPAQEKEREKGQAGPRANPGSVIARLVHYYQTGNLKDFVGLFTANAQVSGGSGVGYIRSDYAQLFAEKPQRRLSVGGLKWQPGGGGAMTGIGSYRALTRKGPDDKWRTATGRLQIELVPWKGGYKISKLYHR